MSTDEEKQRIAKLLQNIDIQETKLSERCSNFMKELRQKFIKEIEGETNEEVTSDYVNPYIVDAQLLEETENKLRQLKLGRKAKKQFSRCTEIISPDPNKPWRTHSNKEKLLCIDNELKRHIQKAGDMTEPLSKEVMENLVKECREQNNDQPVITTRLRETVDEAKKNLPNFQYKKICNTTATKLLHDAHSINTIDDS
ncbi:uncharacterized protein LOC115442900 [Manduca sexta]|uniref:uncharacterized protein LOC115442900 n=1 Tax=Manduca sexta TaxID=7130 RepID=UPI001183C982|nr:uncharacterized protein LOC115442900 [Manduca sexta]